MSMDSDLKTYLNLTPPMCYLPKQEEEDVTLSCKKNFTLVAFRCLFHIKRMGVEICQNWTLKLCLCLVVCVEKEKDVISRTEDTGIHTRAPTREEDAYRERETMRERWQTDIIWIAVKV